MKKLFTQCINQKKHNKNIILVIFVVKSYPNLELETQVFYGVSVIDKLFQGVDADHQVLVYKSGGYF